MEPANWARTLPRLERNIAELEELGCRVVRPPDFQLPPSRRRKFKQGGPVNGPAVLIGEHGPELLLDRGQYPPL
jgi:hypothetical protein